MQGLTARITGRAGDISARSWVGQGYGGLAEEPKRHPQCMWVGGAMNEGKKIGQMIAGLIVVVCIGYILWVYLTVDF